MKLTKEQVASWVNSAYNLTGIDAYMLIAELAAQWGAQQSQDGKRYRFIRSRTSGHSNGLGQYFGWPGPLTVVAPKTILKGSVAEHLDNAIDDAMAKGEQQ